MHRGRGDRETMQLQVCTIIDYQWDHELSLLIIWSGGTLLSVISSSSMYILNYKMLFEKHYELVQYENISHKIQVWQQLHIDGLLQERHNSIAKELELVFLAPTHRHNFFELSKPIPCLCGQARECFCAYLLENWWGNTENAMNIYIHIYMCVCGCV